MYPYDILKDFTGLIRDPRHPLVGEKFTLWQARPEFVLGEKLVQTPDNRIGS